MSHQQSWTAVDSYLTSALVPSDPILESVLRANAAAGLPSHDVSPLQGKLLLLLAKLSSATRILEIGTLGGYSTIWLARALPTGGKLITLEINEHNARIAKANIECAGLRDVVDIRVGPALNALENMQAEILEDKRTDGQEAGSKKSFDFVFIDADKANNKAYAEWALRYSRKGTVIVVDNVVRDGKIVDGKSTDESVKGVRSFLEWLNRENKLDATALQTTGVKGWDGFLIAVVVAGDGDGDVDSA